MAQRLDPNSKSFPTRKELPEIPGAPKDAAWFWGKDDNLGRLNLLTPARVKAASAEIKTGELEVMEIYDGKISLPMMGPLWII